MYSIPRKPRRDPPENGVLYLLHQTRNRDCYLSQVSCFEIIIVDNMIDRLLKRLE